MPTQITYMYPASDFDIVNTPLGVQGGWAEIDDPQDVPDDLATIMACFVHASQASVGHVDFGFTAPPTGATIVSVKLKARVFISTAGPDAWDAYPAVTGSVRPAGGTRYFGTTISGINNHYNFNTATWTNGTGPITYTFGTWTTNPATSVAWTISDLQNLKAGLSGAAGDWSLPTAGGNAPAFDVTQLFLEIESTPISANVEPVRSLLSLYYRLFGRRPPRFVEIDCAPQFAAVEVGDEIEMSHPDGPAPDGLGWREGPGERRDLVVLTREVNAMTGVVKLRCADMRDNACLFFGSFRTTLGYGPDYQGIPMLHAGGGPLTVARAQTAYIQRPGDRLFVDAPSDLLKFSADGLAIEGSLDKNWILNSTFSQGSGSTFTSWTNTTGGAGTLTADLGSWLFDVSGLRRSPKVTVAASGDSAFLDQIVSPGNVTFRVKFRFFADAGPTRLGIIIRRGSDGKDWNDATATWDPANVINFPASAIGLGSFISKLIAPGSATTIDIFTGFFSVGGGSASGTAHPYSVELLTAGSLYPGATPVVTTTATVTRVADQVSLPNPLTGRVWLAQTGCFAFGFIPMWNHTDLADAETKVLLSIDYVASSKKDRVYYERVDGNTGKFHYVRATSGATQPEALVQLTTGALPVAGTMFRVGGLWTDGDGEGQLGLGRLKHQLYVFSGDTNVKSTLAVITGTAGLDGTSKLWLGSDLGATPFSDGFFTFFETCARVPYPEELYRKMGL